MLARLAVLILSSTAPLQGPSETIDVAWRWVPYTTETGLPSNQIVDLVETTTGTLWVTTGSGLAWYDEFRWHQVALPLRMGWPSQYHIAPDLEGGVLLSAGGRLFQATRQSIELIPVLESGDPLPVHRAIPIDEDHLLLHAQDRLWLNGPDNLTDFPIPPEFEMDETVHIRRTASGTLWLTGEGGTFEWSDVSWRKVLDSNSADIQEDDLGTTLFHAGNDLWQRKDGSAPEKVRRDGKGHVMAMAVGRAGQALVTDHFGLVQMLSHGAWQSIEQVPSELLSPRFLRYDSQGDLWVGSDRGLFLHPSRPIWTKQRLGTTLSANQVNAILHASNGDLWLGTNEGIAVRRVDGSVERIRSIDGQVLEAITGLAQDRDGAIWVTSGRDFPGAFRWDGRRWRQYGAAQGLTADRVHRVKSDSQGRVWFLGLGLAGSPEPGAFVFDGTRFESWGTSEGLLNGRVYEFAEGRDGELWFATLAGISRWKDGEWRHWTPADGLGHPRVFTLAVGKDGRVWFGHQVGGFGLGYLDIEGQPQYLTLEEGLVHGDVSDIAVGEDGALWIATYGGLSRYRLGTLASFHAGTGLDNTRLWPVLVTQDSVYVGTVGSGLYSLGLDRSSTTPPVLELRPPIIDEERTLFHWHAFARRGELLPSEIETRYRLDEGPWSEWSTAREVSVTKLPPGEHIFSAQAKNLLGKRSTPATLTYRIRPPFFQHPVFVIAVALWLLTVAVVGGYHWRRQRTQRKLLQASEQRHRSLAERHEALLRAVPDHIFRISADGTYLDYAPASGFPTYVDPEQFLGKNVRGVMPPDVAERSLAAIKRAVETSSEQVLEYELRGDERGGHFEVRIVRSGDSEVVATVRDITEQRAAEEQHRKAQKMEALGHLSGGMAHEFNNLLTVIQANAELVARELPPQATELQSELTHLQEAVSRGAALIRKLMAFSRHEMLALKPIDLSGLVHDFSATLRRLLPENVEMDVVAEEPVPDIMADPGAIEQILINLATNACHAMPTGGKLNIEIGRGQLDEQHRASRGWGEPGDYVVLTVSDSGQGMDEAMLQNIFDPFFTTKPVGAGTGLGLPMTYGLIRQHRGFVDVESEPRVGTTVRLYFPFHSGAKPVVKQVPPSAAVGGGETVLLVEDEEAVRRTARRVLERSGYHVLEADNGQEALEILRELGTKIALVISDVVMPKMSGTDLCEIARRELPNVRFVLMSGYAAKDTANEATPYPSIPFLHKPWTTSELLDSVRAQLDRRTAS
jgi:PAS domain S-box-containing protein